MSDIVNNALPSAEKLAEPIYYITWRAPIGEHMAESPGVGTSGIGQVLPFRIPHKNRVIGYHDGTNLYILGSERMSQCEVAKNDLGGYVIRGEYNSTAQPKPIFKEPPKEWSDRKEYLSDEWNIGVHSTRTNDGYYAPPPLSGYEYIGAFLENTPYFTQGYDSFGFTATADLSTTAKLRGNKDIVIGNYKTYYHYDDKIGNYTKAIRAVFSVCEKSYDYAVNDFATSHMGILPDNWIVGGSNKNYLTFANLLITKDFKAAKQYLKDGTIPPDALYDDPDSDPSATEDGDDNNGGEGDSASDVRQPIELNNPPQTALSLSNAQIYLLTKSQLIAFISDMWDFSWSELATNMMTGIYNNLIDNVLSIRVMPFSGEEMGSVENVSSIQCGWWAHTASVLKLKTDTTGGAMPKKTAGTFEFKEIFKGWADYSPYTSIELYLPYYGSLPLDTNLFMSHTLKVQYVIDALTGTITYYLFCDKTFAMSYTANVSANVPVSLSSRIEATSDIAKNLANFGENASGLRPVGIVSGSTTVSTSKLINDATESGKFFMPTKCSVRITRPAYTKSKKYASVYGYPCYGSYKLGSLTGFTVVENYKSHYTKGIKKEEADMIKSIMESGVYL